MSGTTTNTKIMPEKETPLKRSSQNYDSNLYQDVNSFENLYSLLEPKYKDLYEKTSCLLRSTTVDGIIFACNEFYAKNLGYEKNEVIGKSVFDHTAEKSVKTLRDAMKRWKVTEEPTIELWMRRKDGSTFPVLLHGVNLFDNDNLIGRTSILIDLTEMHDTRKMLDSNQSQIKKQLADLKQSNALLVKTEQKYRDLYENSPDQLQTINLDGIILDCNNSYCKYLGYAKKEVLGRPIFDLVAPQSTVEYVESFENWKNTGKISNTKIWFKRKDQSEFLGLINATNLYDIDGKLVGSNTAIRDITDMYQIKKTLEDNENKLRQQNEALKTAYDHLLETEQRYRTLYEKSPDLLRTTDLVGNIVDCNEAYCSTLGYPREEVVGKSLYSHVAEKSTDDLKDALSEWHRTGSIKNREIWLQRKDGSVFPTLLLSTNLFDKNGCLVGRIGALRDMTVLYEAKKEIEEHKTKRLTAIGELSSRIAHDLRNPLSVINNTMEIIKIQNPDFEQKNKEKFDRLERAVKRMTHQIEEVMDYVLPKPLDFKNTSLLEVINSAISNVQTEYTKIYLPQNDVNIICDPIKIEIVFTNLLLNAIQAMDNRGNIYLRMENTEKDNVTIEVEDTGPGIPSHLLPKIFDPLFTTRQIGTGLGLVSCKNIIEKHSGSIDIITEINKGTKFVIRMPVLQKV